MELLPNLTVQKIPNQIYQPASADNLPIPAKLPVNRWSTTLETLDPIWGYCCVLDHNLILIIHGDTHGLRTMGQLCLTAGTTCCSGTTKRSSTLASNASKNKQRTTLSFTTVYWSLICVPAFKRGPPKIFIPGPLYVEPGTTTL